MSTQVAQTAQWSSRSRTAGVEGLSLSSGLLGTARALRDAVPLPIQLFAVVSLGVTAAAWVGYETSLNPYAGPAAVAMPVRVALRVAIILTLILGGLAARHAHPRRAFGRLLVFVGFFSCLWLLNGSRNALFFSVGLLASVLAPGLFCYLMLAFPSGWIESSQARRFIAFGTGVMALTWLLGLLSHRQLIFFAPLLDDKRHTTNPLYLGLPDAHAELAAIAHLAWLALIAGTSFLLIRRARRANPHVRRLLSPLIVVAVASAACIAGFTLSLNGLPRLNSTTAADASGLAYVATALAIPLAISLGFAMERLSLARNLTRFLNALGTAPVRDVQEAMANTLNDPNLRIYYWRAGYHRFIDLDGLPFSFPPSSSARCQTVIKSSECPVAIVDFDANLSDQEEFIQAAGNSAAIWLERERLAAELAASKQNLEVSRERLTRTADEERRRIQRDLHDGAQQHLIGMHLKLELALGTIRDDPKRSAKLLAEIGEEMGETANDLRSLASGMFPPTLSHYGLVDALDSTITRMGLSVQLEVHGVRRHAPEIEVQVYFVCLEGLQNLSKHCGPNITATLRLWEVTHWLYIELRDSGGGFDPEAVEAGSGLRNMRDRLESVGGFLKIRSEDGHGTAISGMVPLRTPPEPREKSVPLAHLSGASHAPNG
jgi:signal transduction histidine kinase